MPHCSAFRAVLMSQAMPGATKCLSLLRLQHVERFFVGERRVIDVLDAVADALLDRSGRAGMRGKHLVPALRLLRRHGHFFFRHRRLFGAHAGDLLAGEVELDGVDAVFDELADGAAHFFRAGDDDAKVKALVRNVRRRRVPEAADGRDLRARRQIARPGKAPFIDEASWRRRRAAALRPPRPAPR